MIEEPILGDSLGIEFSLAGLSELRGYYETLERVLEETGKWNIAAIEKRAKELPVEQQQYYKDFYHPSRWLISFPSELRASIIVSAMSFLESQLWQISLSAQYHSQVPFKKPKKRILSSYIKYLQDHGRLTIKNGHEWNLINKLYLLRNILVHDGMYLGSEDEEGTADLKSVKDDLDGLSIDQEKFYVIEKTLCNQMFDCMAEFLDGIKEEVRRVWEARSD